MSSPTLGWHPLHLSTTTQQETRSKQYQLTIWVEPQPKHVPHIKIKTDFTHVPNTIIVRDPDQLRDLIDLLIDGARILDWPVAPQHQVTWHQLSATVASEHQVMWHHPCPCTMVEQDPSCPVGYPSLLCEICDGKGIKP